MVIILFCNLYYLQIISFKDYQTRSNENRIKVMPVVPPRGIIYDRNHVVLAENSPVYHLVMYPNRQINTEKTIRSLSKLLELGLSEKEIKRLLYESKTRKRFSGVELSNFLTEEQIATFAVNSYKYPNTQVVANLKRFYPFADITTHTTGYVSRINTKDVKKLQAEGKLDNYEGSTEIGKLGIEKYYEDYLHGMTGSSKVEVNSHGQIIRTLKYDPPEPGRDLTLTIDIRLQYYAQEIFGKMKGAVIAIDPANGEILAMYSNPSYDPNPFVRGIRNGEYSRLINNPGRPLINRATQGGYAPASTVKPLLCVMGLNEKLISPNTPFFGPPYFKLPGSTHQFRDWRAWGHGWMDLYRAIEISADTYFYDLAYRAGINRIHDYLDRFGFGRTTGVDLYEESLGINPSREWKRARFNQQWHLGDTVPIGIGQGYWTSTLIQLAKAHSTLANRGITRTPHLLKEVIDPLTAKITKYKQKESKDTLKVESKDYFDTCASGMYLVVNGPEGTGRRAFFGAKYKAAGKSGTAQVVSIKQGEKYNASKLKAEHRDNALFVAFAPFKKPRILVAVILENEGGGSTKAAPIARAMIDKYLIDLYPNGYMGDEPEVVKFGMGGTVVLQ
ncbi:penicillin-binding protein 2 [Succinivibrio sp. AGMB01872]|uniref:Peptidoglycan D,D-transpeptidase MrdA n=2 Tax=Succinivibrio faecicola TaxID=2820300 RepID=A0ABS7DE35_9GAMM|nr:penicillin-binding protein 2 [Succinivibrio faecicola]